MAREALEAKAHDLLRQLGPRKLAAVVQLLKVMIHDQEDEVVTEEDCLRVHQGQAWFAQRGAEGIPMDEVLAEYGLTADDFPLIK